MEKKRRKNPCGAYKVQKMLEKGVLEIVSSQFWGFLQLIVPRGKGEEGHQGWGWGGMDTSY